MWVQRHQGNVTKASELLEQWITQSVGFDNFFFFFGVSIYMNYLYIFFSYLKQN